MQSSPPSLLGTYPLSRPGSPSPLWVSSSTGNPSRDSGASKAKAFFLFWKYDFMLYILTLQKLSQPCWRGSAILQQCETQSLATTELLLKGSKDHHGLRRSSTQGSGQVGMRMMRTRLSRKGLGLAVQGQVCGGGQLLLLFPSFLTSPPTTFFGFSTRYRPAKRSGAIFKRSGG